jgi:hypothetical protein
MTGGGCRNRKRKRPAPLGFFPLQRLWYRKSTNPGVPRSRFVPLSAFLTPSGVYSFRTVVGLFRPTNALGVPSGRLEGRIGTPFGVVLGRILPAVGGNPKAASVQLRTVVPPPEGFSAGARVGRAQENALLQSRCPERTIKPDREQPSQRAEPQPVPVMARTDTGCPVSSAGCPSFAVPEGAVWSGLAGGA